MKSLFFRASFLKVFLKRRDFVETCAAGTYGHLPSRKFKICCARTRCAPIGLPTFEEEFFVIYLDFRPRVFFFGDANFCLFYDSGRATLILHDFVMDPKFINPKIEERGRVFYSRFWNGPRQYILQDFGMALNGMGRVNKFRGDQYQFCCTFSSGL